MTDTAARVVLVFPPLVEHCRGSVYPSTAVLAAHLRPLGVPVRQVDLNTGFFRHLLTDAQLAAHAAGTPQRATMLSRAAASWVRRHLRSGGLEEHELIHYAGGRGSPLDAVVHQLTAPYTVDPDRSVIDGTFGDDGLVEAYRRYFDSSIETVVDAEGGPVLVGISVPMGPQLLPALIAADSVRRRLPADRCRLVLGGPTLSLLDERDVGRLLERHPSVDAVVRFDGEGPLYGLVEQLAAGEWHPEEVPGVSAPVAGEVVHVEPGRGPDLNELPTPEYCPEVVAGSATSSLAVLQARGCYWGKCDYCDFVEVYKGSPSYRGRRAERVVEDIRTLRDRFGVRRYRLITESIPASFARSFSAALLDDGLDVTWHSFVMVDRRFDTELLRLMGRAGCEYLVVGLESMTTTALRRVHKSADREENIRFLSDAHDAGIGLSVNLIPNLPGTTYEEAFDGLADLERLADCMRRVQVFEFDTTRSSRVGRAPEAFGLRIVNQPPSARHSQFNVNALPVEDPAMTAEQRREVMRAYRAFAARVNGGREGAEGPRRRYVEVLDEPEGPVVVDLEAMTWVRYPPRLRPAGAARGS